MQSIKRRNVRIAFSVICMMPSLAAMATERPSDTTISLWVAEEFSKDPRITATSVDIRTSDGMVTLNGRVRGMAGKTYAGMAARKINGVRGVVNNLVVETVSRSDEEIGQNIQVRLGTGGIILSEGINVTVADGVVTLTGEVASWTEHREAESRAGEVRGVRDVRNNLKMITHAPRADDAISLEIQGLFHRDIYLSGLPILVSVKAGIVTLGGEVGNAFQRDRAARAARGVAHVRDVVNTLTVQWWPEPSKRQPIATPDAQELQKNVHRGLAQDNRIDSTRIIVLVSQGHVTLNGSVPTYNQSTLAEQVAREVVGVAWVSNQLSVNAVMRNDTVIQAEVQSQINGDYVLSSQDIRITVRGGLVTLSGTVNTLYEKSRAAEVPARVRGIRGVSNKIVVRMSPTYTNTLLKNQIKSHLEANWATRWIADRIHISVFNGTVTLSGAVYTWGQRNEAVRVVLLTEGVQEVINHLSVTGTDYAWNQPHITAPEDTAPAPNDH